MATATSDLWLLESPMEIIAGESVTFSVEWLGATTLASPTAYVYFNNTDVTSSIMASGSHSVSGNIQTLKAITARTTEQGGSYVITIECTVDGNTERRKFELRVLSASERQ